MEHEIRNEEFVDKFYVLNAGSLGDIRKIIASKLTWVMA